MAEASHTSLSPATSLQERVTFLAPGVAAKVGEDNDDLTYVGGSLQIAEKPYGVFIEWIPSDNPDDNSSDWVLTPSTAVSYAADSGELSPKPKSPAKDKGERAEMLKRLRFSADIKDLRSFQCYESRPKKTKGAFSPWIRLMNADGTNYVPLFFRDGGISEFTAALQRYATLKRSAKDNNLILFADEKADALAESVSLLFQTNQAHPNHFFSKLIQNPYATAMTGLGKVTNYLNDSLVPGLMDPDYLSQEEHEAQMASMLPDIQLPGSDLQTLGTEGGYELVTYELPPRPAIDRSAEGPVDAAVWASFRTPDGRIERVRELQLLIFRGGVAPELRKEIWKYQLGVWDWSWTPSEREAWRSRATDDYYRMKLQWKSISESQSSRWALFADFKALIEKDVARTDRTHVSFLGADNANLSLLNDILMTYVMYNFDLGYVQGMSDLLSPLLVVMDNEVEAFWTFVGFMNKIAANFSMDQQHIKTQLMQLRDLMMLVTPRLANYLESQKSDNMYFTFRWLLVLFKREFSFSSIQRLWEILWTDLPCQNFHLLFCVAILDSQTNVIIENNFGFTEILKHINDMTMHIDLGENLEAAEGIFHQLAATQDKIPAHISAILGFPDNSSPKKTPTPPQADTPT